MANKYGVNGNTTPSNQGIQIDLQKDANELLVKTMLEAYYETWGYPAILITNERVNRTTKQINDIITVFGSSASQYSDIDDGRTSRKEIWLLIGTNSNTLVGNQTANISIPIYSSTLIEKGSKIEVQIRGETLTFVVADEPEYDSNSFVYSCTLTAVTSFNDDSSINV